MHRLHNISIIYNQSYQINEKPKPKIGL